MRLNGWQRLGVVASLAWIGYVGTTTVLRAVPDTTWGLALWIAAFYAFVPVLLGWLAVWVFVRLTRWVWRGFFPA